MKRIDILRRSSGALAIVLLATPAHPAEQMGSAEPAFIGRRASVECGTALERFGPGGSEFKGLLR